MFNVTTLNHPPCFAWARPAYLRVRQVFLNESPEPVLHGLVSPLLVVLLPAHAEVHITQEGQQALQDLRTRSATQVEQQLNNHKVVLQAVCLHVCLIACHG